MRPNKGSSCNRSSISKGKGAFFDLQEQQQHLWNSHIHSQNLIPNKCEMFLPRKYYIRIRSLILYILIFLLGFTTCLLYIQFLNVSTLNPDTAPQVVLDEDYYATVNSKTVNDLRISGWTENSGSSSSSGSANEPCAVAIAAAAGGGVGDGTPVIGVSSSASAQNSNKNINTNLYYEEVLNNDLDSSSKTATTRRISNEPTVWVVTPTFYRPEQKPELTRIAQALLPANHFIHWIVVDDISQGSEESLKDLQIFLQRFPINTSLLKSIPRSEHMKIVGRPRGVNGRRAAIAWLRKNAQNGVVYFADDDNTYDSDIFRQMQHTKKVSMWPVGLVTELGVSSPIVKYGRVVGFYDGWNGLRKFPVDMAGFAINMELFHQNRRANMPWVAGYEEDELLRSLGIKTSDIVPLAKNCTEILVWHTKALRNGWPKRPTSLKPQTILSTNLNLLLQNLPQKHLAGANSSTKSDVTNEAEKFSFLKLLFGGN